MRPDFDRRLGDIVSGHEGVGRGVDPVRDCGPRPARFFAVQPVTRSEHRRPAGAKLFRFHLPSLEIVADQFAGPKLVFLLDAHPALGNHLFRFPVNRHAVGSHDCVAVTNQHAISAEPQTCLIVVLHPALIRQRLDLQVRLLLAAERTWECRTAKDE